MVVFGATVPPLSLSHRERVLERGDVPLSFRDAPKALTRNPYSTALRLMDSGLAAALRSGMMS